MRIGRTRRTYKLKSSAPVEKEAAVLQTQNGRYCASVGRFVHGAALVLVLLDVLLNARRIQRVSGAYFFFSIFLICWVGNRLNCVSV